MKKLEKLSNKKFQKLEEEQMKSLKGGQGWHYEFTGSEATVHGSFGSVTKDSEAGWDIFSGPGQQ